MRRCLPALLALSLSALVLTGCQPVAEADRLEIGPEHEAAWEVFEEAKTELLTQLRDDSHAEYVGLADLGIKTPAGVALYARGMDANYGGEEPDPRYTLAVVNLADGVIFAEQAPRGIGVHRFDTLEEYDAWDWREHAISLPDLSGSVESYAEQLEQAQRAYYETHGTFATAEELIAFAVEAPAPVPDVSPLPGYVVAASADRYGYLVTIESPVDEYTQVIEGYGPNEDAGGYRSLDLAGLVAEYDGSVVLIGVNADTGYPLSFVTVDPADLDDDNRVPAVALPDPASGVGGR